MEDGQRDAHCFHTVGGGPGTPIKIDRNSPTPPPNVQNFDPYFNTTRLWTLERTVSESRTF